MGLPNAAIGGSYAGSTLWQVVESLTAIGDRSAGNPGEAAAARVIAETLAEHGAGPIERHEFDIPGWVRGSSKLHLEGRNNREFEGDHEVLALLRSPSGTVTGPVLDLGRAHPDSFDPEKLEGTIALTSSLSPKQLERWVHRTEKYKRAIDAGAVGFLFEADRDGALPPAGNVGLQDGPGAIPAAGISREVAARIRHSRDQTATLHVECKNPEKTSESVTGRLGPADTPEIYLTAHHDAHDIAEGALDNAAGCAVVCEVASLLADIEEELDRGIRFITFGAEEPHLLGSEAWVAEHSLDDVGAIINLDGLGSSGNGIVYTHGIQAFQDVFSAASEAVGADLAIRDGVLPWGDQWPFVARGVPGVMVTTESAGEALRGWGHTHGDTIDKLDRRELRELAIPIAAAVYRLATGPLEIGRSDPAAIKAACEEEGHAPGLRVTGKWPWQ